MNRRLMPVTIVVVTLTMVVGLLNSIRLYAASAAQDTPSIPAAIASGAGFSREPINQGEFTRASRTTVFQVEVEHTGDALTDTFDLDLDSSWPAALFGPDGTTPLTDTNGSGLVDTGVISKGHSFLITTKIDTPSNAKISDANDLVLTIQSTISASLAMTALMQSAVPAPFAQTLYHQSGRNMNLIMSQPDASWRAQTTNDEWYGAPTYPDMAVAETISGYVYIWSNQRYDYTNGVWKEELEYRFTDKPGQPVGDIVKLTDHASATDATWDTEPAVDIAPNGNIGVAWSRNVERNDGFLLNNVYLSILDPSGQPVTDTINLTSNLVWRDPDPGQRDIDAPFLRSPRIAATGDNHFFVAWESQVLSYTEQMSQTQELDDVYYAILSGDGVSVTEAINASNNVPAKHLTRLKPALTGVGDDRVFLSWAQKRPAEQGGDDILYTVINSANETKKTITAMADDESTVEWGNFDVVELSTGQILAAWEAYDCPGYPWTGRIRYAVFQANTYSRIGHYTCLPPTVLAVDGDDGVSLAADNMGRAILTWTDRDRDGDNRKRLYYALLKSNGLLLTGPMIFYHSGISGGLLSPGMDGYGSASRVFLDAGIAFDPTSEHGTSEDPVAFTINYRNYGAVTGTDVVITMSLAPSLSYHAHNAPSEPTIEGQDVIWNLSDLLPWEQETFDVEVTVNPSVTLKHGYPITATIGVAGQEADLANNVAHAKVVVSRSSYLPLLITPE